MTSIVVITGHEKMGNFARDNIWGPIAPEITINN